MVILVSNILIIGAGGRMGSWFFRYLLYLRNLYNSRPKKNEKKSNRNKNRFKVDKIFLVDNKKLDKVDSFGNLDVYSSRNISDFITEADIVIFCTPTEITIKLLHKLLNSFESGTVIIEVSSIKNQIHKKLKKYSNDNKKNLQFISLHPMFGPGALVSSTSNIILHIPFDNSRRSAESKLVKKIFPLLEIIRLDNAATHDTLISIVISLIYFMNLIFSKMLVDTISSYDCTSGKINLKFLKQISGSSYKVQSILSESILTDDTSLFSGLFLNSPKSITIIKKYGKLYTDLVAKLEKRNKDYLENYVSGIKKEIGSQVDLEKSYRALYGYLNKK